MNLDTIANQNGAVVLDDNKTHENRMEIRSASSNRVYVVAQSKTSGEWQCSCPGWIMKKPGKERGCKHLDAMLPSLLRISSGAKTNVVSLPTAKAAEPKKQQAQAPADPFPVKKNHAPQKKQATAPASGTLTLDAQTVAKLKKCLEDMTNRGVMRYKLQACIVELVETVEGIVK